MRSWFTSRRERDGQVEAVSATTLGGFGAVEDFQAPRLDPRALNLQQNTDAHSLARHIADSDDHSSSSVETSDLIPEDDQSAASSALVFDESKYAADDDDEESVETSSDADTPDWKQRRATDFLKDFFSSQSSEAEDDRTGERQPDDAKQNPVGILNDAKESPDVSQPQTENGPIHSRSKITQYGNGPNEQALNPISLTSQRDSACIYSYPTENEYEHNDVSHSEDSQQSSQGSVSSGRGSDGSYLDGDSHHSSGSRNAYTRRDVEMDECCDKSSRNGDDDSCEKSLYDSGDDGSDHDQSRGNSYHSNSDYSDEADADDRKSEYSDEADADDRKSEYSDDADADDRKSEYSDDADADDRKSEYSDEADEDDTGSDYLDDACADDGSDTFGQSHSSDGETSENNLEDMRSRHSIPSRIPTNSGGDDSMSSKSAEMNNSGRSMEDLRGYGDSCDNIVATQDVDHESGLQDCGLSTDGSSGSQHAPQRQDVNSDVESLDSSRSRLSRDSGFDEDVELENSSIHEHQHQGHRNHESTLSLVSEDNSSLLSMGEGDVDLTSPLARRVEHDSVVSIGEKSIHLDELSQSFSPMRNLAMSETGHATSPKRREDVVSDARPTIDNAAGIESQDNFSEHSGDNRPHPPSNAAAQNDEISGKGSYSQSSEQSSIHRSEITDEQYATDGSSNMHSEGDDESMSSRSASVDSFERQENHNLDSEQVNEEHVEQAAGDGTAFVDSINQATSVSGVEEHQYEFDLEKLHDGPKRGVRRKISFTQSFSSISSDDSMVFGPSKFRSNAQIRRGGRRNHLPPKNQTTMLGDYESDPSTSAHMQRNSQMMDQGRDLDESIADNLAVAGAESSAALGESFADHHFSTSGGESSVFHSDYDDDDNESTVSNSLHNEEYEGDEVSDASDDDSFSSNPEAGSGSTSKHSHKSCSGSATPTNPVSGNYESDPLSASNHSRNSKENDEMSIGSGSSNQKRAAKFMASLSEQLVSHNDDEAAESHKLHEHISKGSVSNSLPCIEEASCETWTTRDPGASFRRKLRNSKAKVQDSDVDPSDSQHSNKAEVRKELVPPVEEEELNKPQTGVDVPTAESSGYVQTDSTASDSERDESDSWSGSHRAAGVSFAHSFYLPDDSFPVVAGFPTRSSDHPGGNNYEKGSKSLDSSSVDWDISHVNEPTDYTRGVFDGSLAESPDREQSDEGVHEEISFPHERADEDYLSSSDESGSQSESGSDSEEESDPRKLVIKEAPLLRLENVTAQTRSSIPESKLRNKSSGGGGAWGSWFGFSKKNSPSVVTQPAHDHSVSSATDALIDQTGRTVQTERVAPEQYNSGNDLPSTEKQQEATPIISFNNDTESNASPSPAAFATLRDSCTPDNELGPSESVAGGLILVQHSVAAEECPGLITTPKDKLSQTKENRASSVPSQNRLKSRPSSEYNGPLKVQKPMQPVKDTQPSERLPIRMNAEIQPPTPLNEAEGVLTQVHKAEPSATQIITSPLGRPQQVIESASPGLDSLETSPSKKSKKKKGKEKKAALTSHIEKRFRKMNRHGDEVSVGSMNLSSRKVGQQFVVPKLFDDVDTSVEKRPWEQVLSTRKANVVCPESPLVVEGLIPEHKLDVVTSSLVLPLPEVEASEIITQNREQERVAVHDQVTKDITSKDDESIEGGESADTDPSDEEQDELMSLRDLTELEKKFGDDPEEVNFEEMWDVVSCDGNTALEFEERKRGKEREKEKKRQQREKAKAARKSKAKPRLRLFNAQGDENVYAGRKSTALSDEFLLALHRVFDDETIIEEDSGSDAEPSIVDLPQTLQRLGSEKSLYLNGDKSVSRSTAKSLSKEQDSGEKESEEEGDDENDCSTNSSSGKRRSRDSTSRKSNSSRGSRKSSRSKKPQVDPAAIFEAELKRQQRAKVMSVSSLKQEMSDRRGTSVRLLQKEFAERRKRSNGLMQSYGASFRSPGSNKVLLMDTDNVDPTGFGHGVGSGDDNFFGRKQEGMFAEQAPPHGSPWRRSPRKLVGHSPAGAVTPQGKLSRSSGGLNGHLSRWEVGDHVTDLDDLMTVQMSPVRTNFVAGAAEMAMDLATSAVSHLPSIPDLPNIPSVNLPSVPNVAMPNMQLPNISNISVPNVPGIRNLPSVSLPGAESFGFGATFTDMPLSTIDEKSGSDEENEAGLLDGGWDDEDVPRRNGDITPARGGGIANAGRFSLPHLTMKVPKPPTIAVAGMGLDKFKKVKNFIPKIPRRIPGEGGSRQMAMVGDDDDRGLLG